jgi:hypothetical protein
MPWLVTSGSKSQSALASFPFGFSHPVSDKWLKPMNKPVETGWIDDRKGHQP